MEKRSKARLSVKAAANRLSISSVPAQKRGSQIGIPPMPSLKRQSMLVSSRAALESKARLHASSRAPRRKDEDGFRDMDDMDGEGDWTGGPKELVPPPNQIYLTDPELKEEFTRVLNANNPHAPPNIVQFNHKEKVFKQLASIDQTTIHFSLDSNLIHKESDEAIRQLNRQTGSTGSEGESEEEEEEEEDIAQKGDGLEETAEEERGTENQIKMKKKMSSHAGEKQLRNQFNFSERASQTLNNPCRDRETATEPPPRVNFSATANQMEIFDAYVEDLIKQDKAKDKKSSKTTSGNDEDRKKQAQSDLQSDDITRVARVSMVMERMVNQNTYDDIAQDFKYYEDPADDFKDKGSLLPLWRFRYDLARKTGVTALCWNPLYKDLFAVAHGSYEFSGQGSGLICLYSLKNPSYPEYVFTVPSGVMCLDSHHQHPYLLAAGMYDGSVSIYDLREKCNTPIYQATAKTGKHMDPVWQVCWQKNDMDGNINFSSVSSDGRVVTWKLVKNELQFQEMVHLKIPGGFVAGPEGTQNTSIGSGTAIGFNTITDHLFLVGSEEGSIYKYSKAYTNQFLEIYQGHHMAVHAIQWNPFHADVFASCGADWTVKIWDHNRKDPMFSFDLNSVVGGIAWAPYASTVIAAVTAEGKVFIFDLAINKYEPLAVQAVIHKKRTKLTHIKFNPTYPVVIVGDDRGTVACIKLSPNLRKALKEKTYSKDNEINKMGKLISFVKEPLLEAEAASN